MLTRSGSNLLFTGLLACSLCALGAGSVGAAESGATTPEARGDDIERRIDELELELEALKREVSESEEAVEPSGAEAASPQATPSPLPAGDAVLPTWHVTPDITFKPGFRVQSRYRYNKDEDHRFFIRRFRLKGSGQIYEVAKYGAELKIDNTGLRDTSAQVENAWVEFPAAQDLNLRVGLFDAPFSRIALTSDSKLLLMDRGLIKDELTGVGMEDNTTGVLAHGRPLEGRFEYGVGVFQNRVFEEVPMPVGRIAVNLLDPAPQGGYGDYRGSYIGEGRRLTIGANAAYVGDASDGVDKFDVYGWGVDLFFNRGPFTLQGEYDRFEEDIGGKPDITTQGGYVQTGLLLEALQGVVATSWLPPIELAARYQDIDDGVTNDRLQWTSVGSNLYIRQHNLKIQTEYTFKDEDADTVQVQLQLDF